MPRADQQFEVDERGIGYGPSRDDEPGVWSLRMGTDEGRIEMFLDKDAMYELWVEVQNVPWPRDSEKEDLRREVVEHTGGMSSEQLREVLGIIKAIQHGRGWSE